MENKNNNNNSVQDLMDKIGKMFRGDSQAADDSKTKPIDTKFEPTKADASQQDSDTLSKQIEEVTLKVKAQKAQKQKQSNDKTGKPKDEHHKNKIKIRFAAISTSTLIALGAGYLIAQREPNIDLSTSKVVAGVADNKSIDEITDFYNSELVAANGGIASNEKGIGTALKNETDINKGLDTIEDYIEVSNELAKLNLDEIISANGGLRDLTPEEKVTVSELSLSDLNTKIQTFKDESDVDYNDFSKVAIEYNRLAMDLKYAEEIINTQISNEGNEFLGKYGELLIQSIIIDETGLDIEDYQEIELKGSNKDAQYNIKYNAEETGQHFVVHTNDSDLKSLLDYHTYFESQSDRVKPDQFKKYKKKALKAINTYKKCCLSDYELTYSGSSEQTWSIKSDSSNKQIRNKVKTLTK